MARRSGATVTGFPRHCCEQTYQDIYALLDAWFRETVAHFLPEGEVHEWKSATKTMLHQCREHPNIIYHVFDCLSRDRLERYIFSLTDDAFLRLVRQRAAERPLVDEQQRSIAAFCRYAYIGFILQFFWNRMEGDIDESVDRLGDLFDDFLTVSIEKQGT